MKILLFCLGICFSIGFSNAQETRNPQNYEDSIALAKHLIDVMPESDLKKQQERFRYLSRTQPSRINTDILLYIDEKIKLSGL